MSDRKPKHLTDPDVDAGETALRWALTHGASARVVEQARVQRRRKQQFRHLVAGATVAILLVTGAVLWPGRLAPTPTGKRPPSVVISAPVRENLPDGSIVDLREGAKIAVDYNTAVRRVTLVQGEAYFTVAPNKAVPFVVSAGGIDVRAVGTEFAVEIGARKVSVLVTEGRVAVDQSASAGPDALAETETLAVVDAGKALAVESEIGAVARPVVVSAAEQSQRLAWRVPRLDLSGTPLSEALVLFNRFGRVRLELADPKLGALKISGVLRPNSPNALLQVLKLDYGLEADLRSDGTLVLRRP